MIHCFKIQRENISNVRTSLILAFGSSAYARLAWLIILSLTEFYLYKYIEIEARDPRVNLIPRRMQGTSMYNILLYVRETLLWNGHPVDNGIKVYEFAELLRYVQNIVLKHRAIILILLFAFGFTKREILEFIR